MPIPNPDKIWPKLEKAGVDEVQKKLAAGVYAKHKVPVVEEWLRRKLEDPKAPTFMYHESEAPNGRVFTASEVFKLEQLGWVDTPAKFRGSEPSSTGLIAEPPTLVRNLAWIAQYGWQHKLLLAIALIIALIGVAFSYVT